MLRFHRTVEL